MTEAPPPRLRFDRHELAGAFGDVGTDLPLLVGLVATCRLDAASVCAVFGGLQVVMGLRYGIPMPVQPLKAMAAIMLTQRLAPGVLAGGGLVLGAVMLVLSVTGLLEALARWVRREVVRGIQLGLGFSLATLALKEYLPREGARGYALGLVVLAALLGLRGQRRVPGPLVVLGAGVLYALATRVSLGELVRSVGLSLPTPVVPTRAELVLGAVALALPQFPLSLGNSVLATSQTSRDLFPHRPVSVRQIGLTYAAMNLLGPLLGGVPACHGCGGMVGFYGFGARTGGAPVLYGLFWLALGLFFARGFGTVVAVFPMPLLGVVLLLEALGLMALARDVFDAPATRFVCLLVAACCVALPYGYAVGMALGMAVAWAQSRGWVRDV